MLYAPPEEKHPEQRIFTMALYVIAAFGAILQYATTVPMVAGGCFLIATAAFMVKAQRLTAKDTIYATHVEWTARTISIGCKLLFPLSVLIALYLVYDLTDVSGLKRALDAANTDGVGSVLTIVKGYITRNEARIAQITTWSLTPPILWWVWRCWFGLLRADRHEPIDFTDSFF